MKLRSLAIVALLAPGFAACGKKDAPAPAPAPAAAPATPAADGDLIKTGIAHATKVYQTIISTKGDATALKAALEALPKVDTKAISEAVVKGGEAAMKTYAAELAALAKLAKEAAPLANDATEAILAPYSVGVEALLPNELATADGGDQSGELAGGAAKDDAAKDDAAKDDAAKDDAAAGAEGEVAVNAEYDALIKILEENAEDPAAAAAALQEHAAANKEAFGTFTTELLKLRADEAAGPAWTSGAGKNFQERLDKLKADHPALFENEKVAEVVKLLTIDDDKADPGGADDKADPSGN